jgi:uncharacterized membrane protein YgdD (TMEM256/DUF423 family)
MRLGVVNAFCSVVVALLAFRLEDETAVNLLRLGAGFQFMHSLATFVCAIFMNSGATEARHAPALFLLGSATFSGSLYARASGVWNGGDLALGIGAALMAGGWGVLFVASGGVDRNN